jgi:hypothetical protein
MATPTHTLSKDQSHAVPAARSLAAEQNGVDAVTLSTQDLGVDAGYVIYVYNIFDQQHIVEQPPLFPRFVIPACEPGLKFAFTLLPAFVLERYEKPGSLPVEYHTKRVDGRKCATSLLNPDIFPGIEWGSQLIEGVTGNGDQTGNNLNAYGCFWSLTKPDDPALAGEIARFRKRLDKTMRALTEQGDMLYAAGNQAAITPLMHKGMEYFNMQAPWHRTQAHMVSCPNCGEPIREGLAYHRNQFGEKCIIDRARYEASIVRDELPRASTPAQVSVDAKAQGASIGGPEQPPPNASAEPPAKPSTKPGTRGKGAA